MSRPRRVIVGPDGGARLARRELGVPWFVVMLVLLAVAIYHVAMAVRLVVGAPAARPALERVDGGAP